MSSPKPPTASKRKLAESIVRTLRGASHEAYFVGGAVRDMVLGRKPSDFDIATGATPDQIEKLFPRTVAVGKAFGVMIVISEGIPFEVATFRRDFDYTDGRRPGRVEFADAKTDASRRDFTVNGLFYDPVSRKVFDWVGGVADARKKIIRTIGEPAQRFREDKLRILRAVRFAVNLDFRMDRRTLAAVSRMRREVRSISAERVRDELVKLFTGPAPAKALVWLDRTGLLKQILPEISSMKGVLQPKEFHPEGDVFRHTELVLERLKKPDVILAMSGLLHDVAKPRTRSIAKGRIYFKGHDREGARMAREILTRLRFSNDIKDKVSACIEWHMQFKDAPKMRPATLKKMLRRETFPTELELHRADCLASHGDLSIWRFIKKKMKSFSAEEIKPELFLRGRDLIAIGIQPGVAIGEILKIAEEKQLDGEWTSKGQALLWARNYRTLKK